MVWPRLNLELLSRDAEHVQAHKLLAWAVVILSSLRDQTFGCNMPETKWMSPRVASEDCQQWAAWSRPLGLLYDYYDVENKPLCIKQHTPCALAKQRFENLSVFHSWFWGNQKGLALHLVLTFSRICDAPSSQNISSCELSRWLKRTGKKCSHEITRLKRNRKTPRPLKTFLWEKSGSMLIFLRTISLVSRQQILLKMPKHGWQLSAVTMAGCEQLWAQTVFAFDAVKGFYTDRASGTNRSAECHDACPDCPVCL